MFCNRRVHASVLWTSFRRTNLKDVTGHVESYDASKHVEVDHSTYARFGGFKKEEIKKEKNRKKSLRKFLCLSSYVLEKNCNVLVFGSSREAQ